MKTQQAWLIVIYKGIGEVLYNGSKYGSYIHHAGSWLVPENKRNNHFINIRRFTTNYICTVRKNMCLWKLVIAKYDVFPYVWMAMLTKLMRLNSSIKSSLGLFEITYYKIFLELIKFQNSFINWNTKIGGCRSWKHQKKCMNKESH